MFTLRRTNNPEISLSREDSPLLGEFALPSEFVGCSKIDDVIAITIDGSKYAWLHEGALHVADVPSDGKFEALGQKFELVSDLESESLSITSDGEYSDLAAFCFGTVRAGDRIAVGTAHVDTVFEGANFEAVRVSV